NSDHRINEHLLVWQHCLSTSKDHGLIYNTNESDLVKCDLHFGNFIEKCSQQSMTFRIQTSFDICIENNFKALRHKIHKLRQELQCPSTTFLIKDCNMFLSYGSSFTTQDRQTCGDLLNVMVDVEEEGSLSPDNRKTKCKKGTHKTSDKAAVQVKDAIDVKLLTKISMSSEAYKENSLVPMICYGEEHGTDMTMSLPIDVVVMATKGTLVTELPRMFSIALAEQLRQMQNVVQRFSEDNNWCVARPCHFQPPGFSHFVTFLYPEINSHGQTIDENILELYRTEIHRQLLLPLNRPLLRVCNRYIFEKDRKPDPYLVNPHAGICNSGNPYLINPHAGICNSGMSDGTMSLVDGNYSYHHYMQDNFNDDKWGCAYRSLQTIFSWFRHQGYTTNPVPSHRQIQQALVDVGDKKPNFVGSRQWIGSFEVSMCLEKLVGVTSKIMFVNSGAEMASKGRELLHHFETQGTPIMIGGGVLAHTIIGVDFSQQTGDTKFLILDPHYTGSEDLKAVLDKASSFLGTTPRRGWCGWKGSNFWDQQAHYNMCMPQRPAMI
ncbi:hypothetical protein QZH41_013050, partial [Actinostola sp. cb2023]